MMGLDVGVDASALLWALPFVMAHRRKTLPEHLLEHPLRKLIVDIIARLRGINEVDLQEECRVKRGALRHHLQLLEQADLLTKVPLGRESHYFPRETDSNKLLKLTTARHGRSLEVLREILLDPGVRQKVLANRIRITRKVLRGCLNALVEAGLVDELVRGRLRCYFAGPAVDTLVWRQIGLTDPADISQKVRIAESRRWELRFPSRRPDPRILGDSAAGA